MNSALLIDSFQPIYGISEGKLQYSRNYLKLLLGLEYTLYVKTQNYHWNITGISFASIHELLGDQYKQLQEFIDSIAEQIRKYGSAAPGSMQEFLGWNVDSQIGISEVPGNLINQENVLSNLLGDNQRVVQFINSANTNNLDLATQNLLGDILDFHMKNSWMLRSHLE